MKEKENSITLISNQDATVRPVTRRRFLETSLIAGAGTLLSTAPFARAQQTTFYKGMCYQPMPFYVNGQETVPYNPSIANTTRIFFGSDIAYDCMEPLWGTTFISKSGTIYRFGRNDLQTLERMGVNLLRLYDWEPRNYHKRFLDKCVDHGIKVLAPVSNYFLNPREGYGNRANLIPALLNSFSNGAENNGTDYHEAIAGIIIGNEPNIANPPLFGANELSQFTKDWVAKEENKGFQRRPRIGHPQDFGIYGGTYPAWTLWTTLLDNGHLGHMRDRLFLAINTFNPANDLFVNFNGDNMGYVKATYNNFGVPLLITELGNSRSRMDPHTRRWVSNTGYLDVVKGQLSGSIAYGADHPEQLLGICHFQFADKVWLCPNGDPPGGYSPSEGSFGTHRHTQQFLGTVNYANGGGPGIPDDFTHFDCIPGTGCPGCPPCRPCQNVPMKPDMLMHHETYELVAANYNGRPR